MYDEASGAPGQAGGVGLGPMPDAFGPTQRPNEQLGAGQMQQGEFYDPIEFLRIVYAAYPSPWIASLIGDDF